MAFFNRKKEIHLVDFCYDYYERNFLEPIIEDVELASLHNELMVQKIREVDEHFNESSYSKFFSEIIIVKFEVFAIAWLHHFGEKIAINNSVFTKDYLNTKNRIEIWDEAEVYNQAVARSSNLEIDPKTSAGKSRIMTLNKIRWDSFNKLLDAGYNEKCVARVLNRIGTENTWKKTITPNFIRIQIEERLECKLNEEAAFRLTAFIFGFYRGARQSFETVKIRD